MFNAEGLLDLARSDTIREPTQEHIAVKTMLRAASTEVLILYQCLNIKILYI